MTRLLPSGVAVAVGGLEDDNSIAGGELWVAPASDALAMRVFFGSDAPLGPSAPLSSVCTTGAGYGIAAGHYRFSTVQTAHNTVIESADEGASWISDPEISLISSLGAVGWQGTACSGEMGFWLVGTYALGTPGNGPVFPPHAEIAHSADGGATWVDQSENVEGVGEAGLICADFADETTGWAAGSALDSAERAIPLVLHTGDGGLRWSVQSLPGEISGVITSISFTDARTGVAVGYETGSTRDIYLPLAFLTTDGETWQSVELPEGLGAVVAVDVVR